VTMLNPPCISAAFIVNSETQTGVRPSVRLCVGLIKPVLCFQQPCDQAPGILLFVKLERIHAPKMK